MGGVVDRRAGVADVPYPAKVAVAFELVVVQPLCLERARRAEPPGPAPMMQTASLRSSGNVWDGEGVCMVVAMSEPG